MTNENKTAEGEEQEIPTTSENGGDKTKAEELTVLEEAKLVAKNQRIENDRHEALLKKEEELLAERALGGNTSAGTEPEKKQLTEEETASRNRIKAVGLAGGAGWAKDMDKQDGKI